MRNSLLLKAFFCSSLSLIILFILYLTNVPNKTYNHVNDSQEVFIPNSENFKNVYILEWTLPDTEPFVFLGTGQEGFKRRNCKYTNCYVTSNRSYLRSLKQFDAILFHGPEIHRQLSMSLPHERSPHQKYVFASMESSHYYPICTTKFDNYFNWTWTFRLDSDARWGYILVKNSNGSVIGPNKVMHWMKLEDMDQVDEAFKEKLKSKRKAAAWFVSNCNSLSGRKNLADQLDKELKKYGLGVDVYGGCGPFSCSRYNKECEKKIEELYYFYLAFENSFSEDYVTEKLLHGLKNNAVPIVFGGANYSRFMPDGIYLNARELGVEKLAEKMNELILNPEKYAEHFRWKKHYSFHSREEDDSLLNEYCGFCALLNDKKKMQEVTIKSNFKEWWNNPDYCR